MRIEDGPGQFGMFVVGLGFDFFWVCGGLSGHVIVAGAVASWFGFSSAAPRHDAASVRRPGRPDLAVR